MTPKAPDPYETAQAQNGYNFDSAVGGSLLNNMDQTSPFGSIKYTQNGTKSFTGSDGKTYTMPNFSANTTFSPEQQKLYDRQVQTSQRMGDLAYSQASKLRAGAPFSAAGLPARGRSLTSDFSADRRRVEGAVNARYDEGFKRDYESKKSELVAQGLTPGSEAWNAQMDALNRAKTDARSQAILIGGQEQSRLSDLDLRGQQWQESLRGNALNENMGVRNQQINEIAALLSGSPVSAPQFGGPFQQGVGAAPVGQYINDNYANQSNQYNSMMSGLFGLGSAGMTGLFGLSDRRAKTGIRKIGKTNDDQNIYSYRYKGDPETRVGLMAQEVLERKPEAVALRPDGLLAVDYARALEAA